MEYLTLHTASPAAPAPVQRQHHNNAQLVVHFHVMNLLQGWNASAVECIEDLQWDQAQHYLQAALDLAQHAQSSTLGNLPGRQVVQFRVTAARRTTLLRDAVDFFPLAFGFSLEEQQQQHHHHQPQHAHHVNLTCITACCLYNLALVQHGRYATKQATQDASLMHAVQLYQLAANLLHPHVVVSGPEKKSCLLLFMAICENTSSALRDLCDFGRAASWKQSVKEALDFFLGNFSSVLSQQQQQQPKWEESTMVVLDFFSISASLPDDPTPPAPAA